MIGDRAYGNEPGKVAAIAQAVTEGLEAGGVLPILKHIPGHGRATADTHFLLPVVDTPVAELELTDFAAFRPLAHLPMAMTAHVVFSALDRAQPATTSATIIADVIRASIGFQGLLMSDDVSMNALQGTIAERSRASLSCRLRHDPALQRQARTRWPRSRRMCRVLAGQALARADAALKARKSPQPFDRDTARAELDELVARAGALIA